VLSPSLRWPTRGKCHGLRLRCFRHRFRREKYLKAFSLLAESPNQKVLLLPIEAVNVLGSLGGIGEIAKAAFGLDGKAGSPGSSSAPSRRPTGPPAGTPVS
jgi:hypothetical protein